MEKVKALNVTVDGIVHSYPFGTPYQDIAADFQKQYEYDILLDQPGRPGFVSCIKRWTETVP